VEDDAPAEAPGRGEFLDIGPEADLIAQAAQARTPFRVSVRDWLRLGESRKARERRERSRWSI
jgi:hypothetical protein